jgi:hypothetical protein
MRLGMRAGYGYRDLNENLAPLRRILRLAGDFAGATLE